MVITIEPGTFTCPPAPCYFAFHWRSDAAAPSSFFIGVYVPADPQFPKHFHGLGMRIEDEVLVGAEHPVVLSASAPKEVCRHPLAFHFFDRLLYRSRM
jgi:Xaa-Pro aminopeptidase